MRSRKTAADQDREATLRREWGSKLELGDDEVMNSSINREADTLMIFTPHAGPKMEEGHTEKKAVPTE